MKIVNKRVLLKFIKTIWEYYAAHKRDLPWRKNITPYKILVSEVMLQQTQVTRVIPKFNEFVKKFPNFKALSLADTATVLRVWQGLGYNRRALYLKQVANIVVSKHGNRLPSELSDLVKLPGIGQNTAGAILAYAFNKPAVFIETNIRKIFIHHFFGNKAQISDKDLLPIIEKTLPKPMTKLDGRPILSYREWYWALMDYGGFLSGMVENPNRKSTHYSKQSTFEGSLRQVRGKIVRILLELGEMTHSALTKSVADYRLDTILRQLELEGFLESRNGKFFIKK